MTTEEKAARLRSIDIAEEAQFVVIWSCFTTEEQKEAALSELSKLRAERMALLEPEVIENTKKQTDLSDPEEIKLLCLRRDLCRAIAARGKPIETLTLGELATLAPRRRSA